MAFESRDLHDISRDTYRRIADFINGGGDAISLRRKDGNVYVFLGNTPEEVSSVMFSKCMETFYFDGLDMKEISTHTFDKVAIDQTPDGNVVVQGKSEDGRMMFEITVDDIMYDPLMSDLF